MMPQDWIRVATWLGACALASWLALVLRFWWQVYDLGSLPERMKSTGKGLRAMAALLTFYRGSAGHERLAREADELQAQLSTELTREHQARRLVWLLPTGASRRLVEAWSSALACEQRALALMGRLESRVWRRREIRADEPPADLSRPDPIQEKISLVEGLFPDLLGDWHSMELDLIRRLNIGGSSPDSLVNEARAALARPGGRPQAWQALADAAWCCAVAASWGRNRGDRFHADQEDALRALREAEKQGHSAHQAPPFSHDHEYEARIEASRQADALVARGQKLLSLFAWGRANRLLREAVGLYLYTIDRTYNPLDRHPRFTARRSTGRSIADADDPESDESELDLPDLPEEHEGSPPAQESDAGEAPGALDDHASPDAGPWQEEPAGVLPFGGD